MANFRFACASLSEAELTAPADSMGFVEVLLCSEGGRDSGYVMVLYLVLGGVFWGIRMANRKVWSFLNRSMFVVFVATNRTAVIVMADENREKKDARARAATIRPSRDRSSFDCKCRAYELAAIQVAQYKQQ